MVEINTVKNQILSFSTGKGWTKCQKEYNANELRDGECLKVLYTSDAQLIGATHFRWNLFNSDALRAMAAYRDYVEKFPQIGVAAKRDLRGKDLACWCKEGTPCHADILLKIANQ